VPHFGHEKLEGVADVFELGVVEGVKGFRTQFKTAATRLAEYKALEERYVPVLSARTVYRIARHIAKFSGEGGRKG